MMGWDVCTGADFRAGSATQLSRRRGESLRPLYHETVLRKLFIQARASAENRKLLEHLRSKPSLRPLAPCHTVSGQAVTRPRSFDAVRSVKGRGKVEDDGSWALGRCLSAQRRKNS